MSQHLEPFDRVRVIADRFAEIGAPAGSIGYVIERYADGALEIEVSDPSSGASLAQFVADAGDLELANPGA